MFEGNLLRRLVIISVLTTTVTSKYFGVYRVKFISYRNPEGLAIGNIICKPECEVKFKANFSHDEGRTTSYISKIYEKLVVDFSIDKPFPSNSMSVNISTWQGYLKYDVIVQAKRYEGTTRHFYLMDKFSGKVEVSHLQTWTNVTKCRQEYPSICLRFAVMVDSNTSRFLELANSFSVPTSLIVFLIIIPILIIAGLLIFFVGRRRGKFRSCKPPCAKESTPEETAYSVVKIEFKDRRELQGQSVPFDNPADHQYAEVKRKTKKNEDIGYCEVDSIPRQPDVVNNT